MHSDINSTAFRFIVKLQLINWSFDAYRQFTWQRFHKSKSTIRSIDQFTSPLAKQPVT